MVLVDDMDIDPHGAIPLLYPALCATPSPQTGGERTTQPPFFVCDQRMKLYCAPAETPAEPFVVCLAPPDGWVLGPGSGELRPSLLRRRLLLPVFRPLQVSR